MNEERESAVGQRYGGQKKVSSEKDDIPAERCKKTVYR